MANLIEPLTLCTPLAGFNCGTFVKLDMTIIGELILHQGMDARVYTSKGWLIRGAGAAYRDQQG